jgi:hypothetical protein
LGGRKARGRQRLHPATKTFLALRIAVNREEEELGQFLSRTPRKYFKEETHMEVFWKTICFCFALTAFFLAAVVFGPWNPEPPPAHNPWPGWFIAVGLFFATLGVLVH